jgi:hypothetical protein
MNEEEHFACPNCGASVSRTDRFCKSCGKELTVSSGLVQNEPVGSVQAAPEEIYERKYSVFQRLYKVVVSPSEAMRDIGLAPEYGGPSLLVILEIILFAASVSLAFQKIQLTGDSQMVSQVSGILSAVLAIAVLLSVVVYVAYWLVKSLLVKYFCDGGSGWSFGTAAAVTGYAYIADIIFGIIGLLVVYPFLPSLTLNVSNVDVARAALADFQSKVLWIRLTVSIPLGFIAMLWKSYLGGLGTKFGTHEKCSLALSFFVFLLLALLGWLISFLVRGTI